MNWSKTMIRLLLFSMVFLAGVLLASFVHGQVAPEEHAQHHPDQQQETPAESEQGSGTKNAPQSGDGGMMGGDMGGMMDKMGAPKPKGMYPSLMDFPNLTTEQRAQFQQEAHQRMITGTELLSEGLDELSVSAPTDDFAAMQLATSKMREGLAQFESGLAAHRAIAEGKSPQNVALQWFKRNMNLLPPETASTTGFRLFGMSLFHSLIMLTLVLFATVMIWMYFFKMRRASSLLARLVMETDRPLSEPARQEPHLSESRPDGAAPERLQTRSLKTDKPSDVVGSTATCCDDPGQPCEDECAETGDVDRAENGKKVDSGGLLPVAKRKLCKLRIAKIYKETGDVKTFRLVSCHGGPIPFSYLPGQFLTITMPVGKKSIRRSYTIASAPTQGYYCEITVKREDKGAGSRYLHDILKEGDTLEVQAPSGKFVFTGKESTDIVLISGGVGITPMMSIARALTDMGWQGEVYFIVACRDPEHFIFESELKNLQKRHPNLHVFAAMSQAKKATNEYRIGRLDAEMLTDWVPDIASKRVHICGPGPMMEAMKTMLVEMDVATESIHTENFGAQAKPKPTPGKPGKGPTKTKQKASANVEFKTSGMSTSIESDETLLEAAERIGVDIDNSCRVGMCGVCAIKILSGEVSQEIDDGLDPDDRAAGKVLACQATCTSDIVVEA